MASRTNDKLAGKLKDRIRDNGPLTLDQYMSACLLDPDFGYYRRAEIFGLHGDFITAPEISQVFGELIGLWAGVVWQNMGAPKAFNLIELGPGRGTLMADALRALKILPSAIEAARVHLVELSQQLRHIQKKTLCPVHENIGWHDDMSSLPGGPSIILANEFLDALPIRQFVKSGDNWHERLVGLDENSAIHFVLANDVVEPPVEISDLHSAPDGAIFETRNIPETLLPERGDSIHTPFAALFIDYGHVRSAIGDSFQAVQNHAFCDPLQSPGNADLTAHVDFQAFAGEMRARGHIVDGPANQSEFLQALGIIERGRRLVADCTMSDRNKIENQLARLISPDAMGTRFKVIGVRSPDCPALPAFPLKHDKSKA